MQLRELRSYLKRRGWKNAGEYVDTGWSGTKASRPNLDRMMGDAKLHHFDALVVWKIDRFGRSLLHLCQGVDQLHRWGVSFLAVSQGIDTTEGNPTGKLMLQILGAIAEFERELTRERVKAGLASAAAKGRRGGRPRAIFRRDRVTELREAGKSIREIARQLGVSVGLVHGLLKGVQKT